MEYMERFSDCIPVKGDNRSLILDITRGDFEFIPNDLFYFLENNNGINKSDIFKKYSGNDLEVVEEYIDFLYSKEYIFWASEADKDCFPEIERKFEQPYHLTNAVIDLSADFQNIKSFIEQILNLGVKYIQFRALEIIELSKIQQILGLIAESRVERVELFLPYLGNIKQADYEVLLVRHRRIEKISIFGAQEQKKTCCGLYYYAKNIESHKAFISSRVTEFVVNMNFFMEAQFYNTYFNKKIALDNKGYIKNALELDYNYGKVTETNIEDLIQTDEFQKLWHISKERITNCKTCELRYVCFDTCPIEQKNGEYIRKASCEFKG